ncbi:hypothetical protein D1007_34807 [Hordeum vulgare]|nr:hypothetical protein D1007_34807 [Hordeum vulgare]
MHKRRQSQGHEQEQPSKKPQKHKQKHLYLVLDDWDKGYTIRKIDADSPGDLILTDEPPVLRLLSDGRIHCMSFAAVGSSHILAASNQHPATLVYDTETGGLTTGPPVPAALQDGCPAVEALSSAAEDPRSPAPTVDWSWRSVLPSPFARKERVCSCAAHPDGRTIFVTVLTVTGLADRHFRTLSFDAGSREWTCHGDWGLPFMDIGYFDAYLDAWVGLDEDGYVGSCLVADPTPASGMKIPRLDWKIAKDKLWNIERLTAHRPTLNCMGDGRFCLVDCVMREGMESGYADGCMLNLNMDCHVQQREEMDGMHAFESPGMNASNTSFFEHLVYESHSSGQSSSDGEDVLQAHLEGDTDVEELFPIPDEEDLVEEPRVDKTAMIRQARSKDAKAKAIKIRQVKQRAAAGTAEDTFVLSDSCTDDNKEIIDLDDDDGAVLESKISMRKRKSRAMPVKKRTYYDESKSSAHDQLALDLCFHDTVRRLPNEASAPPRAAATPQASPQLKLHKSNVVLGRAPGPETDGLVRSTLHKVVNRSRTLAVLLSCHGASSTDMGACAQYRMDVLSSARASSRGACAYLSEARATKSRAQLDEDEEETNDEADPD